MHEFEGRGYDLSMYLYLTLGERLISRATALAMARMVLQDRFGSEEAKLQEPLVVEEQGDAWAIMGSRQATPNDGRPPGALRHGKATMIISQRDGRIIKLAVEAPIPPVDTAEKGPAS
jgi:NTF2 fold immunity protein